jgi:SAM-dependent methyltransferase
MSQQQKTNLSSNSTTGAPLSGSRDEGATAPHDWWSTFFHGIALDFWKAAMSSEQTRKEADFIQSMLQLNPRDHVLDVPCGNGRLALELAARGLHVTGVDIAPENIDQARAASEMLHNRVHWKCSDMRDLPWEAAFDGAFCFGNSFGYLQDHENEQFLTAMAGTLKSGAGFIISGSCAEALLPHYQERKWFQIGDICFLSAGRYDVYSSRLEIDYTFIRDGKMETRPASQRVYSCGELCRLAERCGFTDFHAYGSMQGEALGLGSPGMLLLMRRK